VLIRRFVTKLATFLGAAVLCVGAIELAARIYDRVSPAPLGHEELARSRPAPYANADFYTPEFGREAFAFAAAARPKSPDNPDLSDFTGQFFNIRSGMRVTAGQPSDYKNAIHVFGGSTVFSAEVPDSLTIPSLLQGMVRQRYGNSFIVHNRGVPGFTANAQSRLLRSVALKRGDVVVFLDGANDIHHSVYYGAADPEIAKQLQASRQQRSAVDRAADFLWRPLHQYSSFVRRFCNVRENAQRRTPAHLRDPEQLRRLTALTRSQYRDALRDAQSRCDAESTMLIHFLQPTLFTQAAPTAYEANLALNYKLIFSGMRIAHEAGYPELKAALRDLEGEVDSHDLTSALNAHPGGSEYFLDDCHVGHEGNALLARQIYDRLVEKLDEGSRARGSF
jgi:hypothetical protein